MIYEKYEEMYNVNIHPSSPLISKYDRKLCREWLVRSEDIAEEFKQALYVEYDVVHNPKRDLLFQISQNIYSAGYFDIEFAFRQLVQLIE